MYLFILFYLFHFSNNLPSVFF